jgi:hypothetical protein
MAWFPSPLVGEGDPKDQMRGQTNSNKAYLLKTPHPSAALTLSPTRGEGKAHRYS